MRFCKNEFSARVLFSSFFVLLASTNPSSVSNAEIGSPESIVIRNDRNDYVAPSLNTVLKTAPQAGPVDLAAATAVPPVFTPRIEAKPDVNATAPYDGAVFSSVAFPIGGLPAKARWQAALAAADRMDFSACATGACPEGRKAVGTAVEAVRGKPVAEQIARVNAVVNHAIAYTRDRESYGKRDYWASPDEALTRGKGDCEDYAITKMAALKAAGIDMNSVALVVLRDVRRRVYHAVLTVSTREGRFVLDNMRDNVLADTDLPDYQALYSLNGSQAFIHGYPASSRLSAGMGAGAAAGSALPGEDTDTNS